MQMYCRIDIGRLVSHFSLVHLWGSLTMHVTMAIFQLLVISHELLREAASEVYFSSDSIVTYYTFICCYKLFLQN
jgi:hypothetical protein